MKDIRNLFRLKKEQNYTAIKDIRNLFRLGKKIKAIKIKYSEILRIFLTMKEKILYKPVRVNNFWSNNCIYYESNSDRNITILVEEYLNKISPIFKKIS